MGLGDFVNDFSSLLDSLNKMKLENPMRYARIFKLVAGIAVGGIAVTGVLARQTWLYALNNMMDVVAKNGMKEQIDVVRNETDLVRDTKWRRKVKRNYLEKSSKTINYDRWTRSFKMKWKISSMKLLRVEFKC